MIQFIQSGVNLIDRCSFTFGIRQYCLNGFDLSLVFFHTRLNGINGKRINNLFTTSLYFMDDVSNRLVSYRSKKREFIIDIVDRFG